MLLGISNAYWVPLQREVDPLNPDSGFVRTMRGVSGLQQSIPLEYDTPVVPLMTAYSNPTEPLWVENPFIYDTPEVDYAGLALDLDSEAKNLVEIEEELAGLLDSMTTTELDEFSDWLVEEGNEKYLETFLGILESQLVKQYNQDIAEEQEIVDVLADIETLESDIHEAEELAQYPVSNFMENYLYDDLAAPAYWGYPEPQYQFQFVDPAAFQSNMYMQTKPVFLARELEPAMKRYVVV